MWVLLGENGHLLLTINVFTSYWTILCNAFQLLLLLFLLTLGGGCAQVIGLRHVRRRTQLALIHVLHSGGLELHDDFCVLGEILKYLGHVGRHHGHHRALARHHKEKWRHTWEPSLIRHKRQCRCFLLRCNRLFLFCREFLAHLN